MFIGSLFSVLHANKDYIMDDIEKLLKDALSLRGALATALVNWKSGMVIAIDRNKKFNIELAASGNAKVIRAKIETINSLGLDAGIEDILITLSNQIHIIRMVEGNPDLFMYLALDDSANLALARNKIKTITMAL